jgi:hypothetical protein
MLSTKKQRCISWLYTTSGYYDKTIKSDYMNATHSVNDTIIYKKYMNTLLDFVKNADIFSLNVHDDIILHDKQLFNNFIENIKKTKKNHISNNDIYKYIENKEILIISPFAPLFREQIINGNVKKIYPEMTQVKNIIAYKNIYTFFNNGPDNNIFETTNKIIEDIKQIKENYDSVIISCGAYSLLLAKELYDIGKNVCVIGGELQPYFGIVNKRMKNIDNLPNKEFWITSIPDEYKPTDYMKIENGCYWT